MGFEAAPGDEHHLPNNVLGVGGVNAPAYVTKQIDVHRVVDLPEALLAIPWRRSRGVHTLFMSKTA